MSTLHVLYDFEQEIIDEKLNTLEVYDKNLPDKEKILQTAIKSFNDAHFERYVDGLLKGNVKSITMKPYRGHQRTQQDTTAMICFELQPGIRLTEKYRQALWDYLDAQMTDGWGEGFFGYTKVYKGIDKKGQEYRYIIN